MRPPKLPTMPTAGPASAKPRPASLPGVSPLVFSRFLLEYTAFLSLNDMGKDLPDYEEIPIPVEMPEDVYDAYKELEGKIRTVLKSDRKAAQKLLSAYLKLLTGEGFRTEILSPSVPPEKREE